VVLLGDTNSGKTSLVLRFVEGTYKDHRNATIGAFFLTKRLTLDSALCCKLLLWDTSGQEQFQKLALTYYRQAAAAVVCVDLSSNDPDRALLALQSWLEQVQHNITSHRIVLVVAGCKADLVLSAPNASSEGGYGSSNAPMSHHHPFALEEQIRAVADRYGAAYVRTSAKNNQGVTQAFQRTASLVLQCQQEAASGRGRPIPVTLGGAAAAASGGTGGGNGTVAIRNPSKSKQHRSLSPTMYSHGHSGGGDSKKLGGGAAIGPSPPNHHRRALSANDPSASNDPDYHQFSQSAPALNSQRRNYPQHHHHHPENRHDYPTLLSSSSRGRDEYDATTMMSGADPATSHANGVASNEKKGYTSGDDDDEDPLHSRSNPKSAAASNNPNLLHHGSKIMCDNGLMLCSSGGPEGTSQECVIL
jgi:small GTP-binding protein